MAVAAMHGALVPARHAVRSPALVLGVLFLVLVAAAGVAASVGAAGIPLQRLPAALGLAQGEPLRSRKLGQLRVGRAEREPSLPDAVHEQI